MLLDRSSTAGETFARSLPVEVPCFRLDFIGVKAAGELGCKVQRRWRAEPRFVRSLIAEGSIGPLAEFWEARDQGPGTVTGHCPEVRTWHPSEIRDETHVGHRLRNWG